VVNKCFVLGLCLLVGVVASSCAGASSSSRSPVARRVDSNFPRRLAVISGRCVEVASPALLHA
jgi:hypothetical protein